MIKEIVHKVEQTGERYGVSFKIPITKKGLQSSAVLATTIGATLVVTGVLVSSKWIALAGGINFASGLWQNMESKDFE